MARAIQSQLALTRRNRPFAKCAQRFANCAAALPGMPMLLAGGALGAVMMITTGAFGSGAMPLGPRAGLWLTLIGWNVAKWQAWFAWRVRIPGDWMNAALVGAVVLNVTLPLEISAVLGLFGVAGAASPPTRVWLEALVISGTILALIFLVRRSRPKLVTPELPEAVLVDPRGILARAGIRQAEQLAGVEAEDHYCRLYLVDGRTVLIHARFCDLVDEVGSWCGMQVHRGSWVRSGAVRGATRRGRRWLLHTDGGGEFSVSGTHLGSVREAGWLRRHL